MMFVWRNCEYAKGYRPGTIAAEAESLALARAKLRGAFDLDVVERYSVGWLDEDGEPYIPPDDWYQEEYAKRKKQFESDIARDPEFPETLFIYGGD